MHRIFCILTTISLFSQEKGKSQDCYACVFKDICLALNVDTAKISFVERTEGGIAECENLENGNANIYYNVDTFKKFPLNYCVGVICHELGHFQNKDHGCIIEQERNADLIAGFSMRKLGYDISASQLFLKIYKNATSICYPTQQEREAAVREGWDSLNKEIVNKRSYNQLEPRVTWQITNTYKLVVKINDRILTFPTWNKYADVVIIYDSITTSTIQLLEYQYKPGEERLGRVVTSQSLYSYFLYPSKIIPGKYNYQVYYKGQVRHLEECSQNNEADKDNGSYDLIIHCKDPDRKNRMADFRLVDYNIAPDYYVLPAVYQ